MRRLPDWLIFVLGTLLVLRAWWEIRHPDRVRLTEGGKPIGAKWGRPLALPTPALRTL